MANKSYEIGRNFEHRVIRKLKDMGFFVIRQGASKFPDLIAVRGGYVFAIECKFNGYATPLEKLELQDLNKQYGMIPVVCRKMRNKESTWEPIKPEKTEAMKLLTEE